MMPAFLFLLAGSACGFFAEGKPAAPPAIGAVVADFTANDVHGRPISLAALRSKRAVVVVFVGTECPLANLYLPTLADMHAAHAGKGVQFLAIYSNHQDSLPEVVAHVREMKVPFPALPDPDQKIADAFGARRTPEAFLLDSGRVIRYHGRIDDQYGYLYRRATPTKTELKDALEEFLAGKPIRVPEAELRGCVIGRTRK